MFKPVGIFFLHLFLYTQVYNTYIWVRYEVNKDEITKLFCENTDKPEMNCHGVCHLKKQIIETQTPTQPEEHHTLYINEIQLFQNIDEVRIDTPDSEGVTHYTALILSFSDRLEVDFFHPPQV